MTVTERPDHAAPSSPSPGATMHGRTRCRDRRSSGRALPSPIEGAVFGRGSPQGAPPCPSRFRSAPEPPAKMRGRPSTPRRCTGRRAIGSAASIPSSSHAQGGTISGPCPAWILRGTCPRLCWGTVSETSIGAPDMTRRVRIAGMHPARCRARFRKVPIPGVTAICADVKKTCAPMNLGRSRALRG
jgi:hypothetical protein